MRSNQLTDKAEQSNTPIWSERQFKTYYYENTHIKAIVLPFEFHSFIYTTLVDFAFPFVTQNLNPKPSEQLKAKIQYKKLRTKMLAFNDIEITTQAFEF